MTEAAVHHCPKLAEGQGVEALLEHSDKHVRLVIHQSALEFCLELFDEAHEIFEHIGVGRARLPG